MTRKNIYIKPAHQVEEYSEDAIVEFDKCLNDPVYFITNHCKLQHGVKGEQEFKLFPYQERMIHGFQENRLVIVLAARQVGKPLWIEEEIPTPTGYRKMKDLEVGDYVLSAQGKPTRVIATSPTHSNKDCYEIYFSTGEKIVCDAEHLWDVQDNYATPRGKTRTLSTQQLVAVGYLISNKRGYTEGRFSIQTTEPLTLPNQQLKIDPYVLGAWLGDGTAAAPEITNHINDHMIIEQVQQHYKLGHVRETTSVGTKTYYFRDLQPILKQIGVFKNKHIPIEYLRGSYEQRLALLQGLMDTDGYANKKTGVCEITFTNQHLCNDVHELICTLGLKPVIHERHIHGKMPHTRWTINYTPYKSQCVVFRLQRKSNYQKNAPHYRRATSTRRRTITKIEKVASVPVRCITVDNADHLYLVGRSMIPTHNSWTAGAYMLWYAMFNKDKTCIIASNREKNALEMIFRIRYMYERLPHWLKAGVLDDGYNKHSFSFENGSRIISEATSDRTARGGTASLLFLDEFAHVRDNIQEEFWTSAAPTFATGGSCIICSTPNGDTNRFAQLWRGAQISQSLLHRTKLEDPIEAVTGSDFIPVEVKWDEPPGRDEKFREGEIRKIGELKWRQEYECEFLSGDPVLVDPVVAAQLTRSVQGLKPFAVIQDIVLFSKPQPGHVYLIGVDPATGTGEDFTAFTAWEFPSMKQIAEYRSNTSSSVTAYQSLKKMIRIFEKSEASVYFSIENNGVGEGMIALQEADESPCESAEFVNEQGKKRRGMTTTGKTKIRVCLALRK